MVPEEKLPIEGNVLSEKDHAECSQNITTV